MSHSVCIEKICRRKIHIFVSPSSWCVRTLRIEKLGVYTFINVFMDSMLASTKINLLNQVQFYTLDFSSLCTGSDALPSLLQPGLQGRTVPQAPFWVDMQPAAPARDSRMVGDHWNRGGNPENIPLLFTNINTISSWWLRLKSLLWHKSQNHFQNKSCLGVRTMTKLVPE